MEEDKTTLNCAVQRVCVCVLLLLGREKPLSGGDNVHCFFSLPQVISPGIWRVSQIFNFDQYKDR